MACKKNFGERIQLIGRKMKKKNFLLVTTFKPCRDCKINFKLCFILKRYNNSYDVFVINVCGEWNDYKNFF